MVTVPAVVWRGGFFGRALVIGAGVGLCLGVLAWLDSGAVVAGGIVFVVVGAFCGVWMARRMARYWPEADQIGGGQRVAVARAVRRGQQVDDERLAFAAAAYAGGLRAAAAETRTLWRWLLGFILVVAAGTAVWDAVFGSWGSAAASAVYLAALLLEIFWWPRRLSVLLARCGEHPYSTGR